MKELLHNPMAVLDRVEAAIARAFKAATTPQDELWYFNALTIIILARKDAEESDTMVKLDAAIDRRKAQRPITVERRVA